MKKEKQVEPEIEELLKIILGLCSNMSLFLVYASQKSSINFINTVVVMYSFA